MTILYEGKQARMYLIFGLDKAVWVSEVERKGRSSQIKSVLLLVYLLQQEEANGRHFSPMN